MANTNRIVRQALAQGAAFARAQEATAGAAGTTLQTAIAEAIYDLDSSQIDPVANLDPGTSQYQEGLARTRMGKLQRIQAMKVLFFGDGTTKGVFDTVREMASTTPDVPGNGQ